MIQKSLLSASVALGLCATSSAVITIMIQADLLKDSAGGAIPTNSLIFLVADTQNDGFDMLTAGMSTSVGSTLTPGGDDYILYRNDLSLFGEPGVLDAFTGHLSFAATPGWNFGDALALVWFKGGAGGITLATPTIAAGSRYGLYTRAVAANGSAPWITPFDATSNYQLGLYTQDGVELSPGPTAVNPPSTGQTTFVVPAESIPEPTSMVFGMAGVLVLASRRRRG